MGYLILTRQPRESIMIGDDIKITVVSVTRNQVKLGMEAPRDVVVDRQEIRERRISEK